MTIQRSSFFLVYLLLPIAACVQWPTVEPDDGHATSSSSETESGNADLRLWPDLPDHSTTADTSIGPGEPTFTSSKGIEVTSDTPTTTSETTDSGSIDPNLNLLLVTEMHSDPAGKDGGVDSPEWIEIYNPSMSPIVLDGLVFEARSWPTKTAESLGLSGQTLLPGQILTIFRYTSNSELPMEVFRKTDQGIEVAFATNSGLRNDDGGALLTTNEDIFIDMLVYGAAQESPFNDPAMWNGEPVSTPSSGSSICRSPMDADSNTMDDWVVCEPSPGMPYVPMPTGESSTGEWDSEASSGTTTDVEMTSGSTTSGDTDPNSDDAAITIVEVYSHPQENDLEKFYEFIEIMNISQVKVELSNWLISDSLELDAAGTDPLLYHSGDGGCESATCLAPGHRAIIVGNEYKITDEADNALVLKVDDTSIAFGGLADHEPVALRDSNQQLRSSYRDWTDPVAEPAPGPGDKAKALVRIVVEGPDEPENWQFAEQPTPGLP